MSYQFLEALQQKSICIYWTSAMLKRVYILNRTFTVKRFSAAAAMFATCLSGDPRWKKCKSVLHWAFLHKLPVLGYMYCRPSHAPSCTYKFWINAQNLQILLNRNFGAKMPICLNGEMHHRSDSYLVLCGCAVDLFFVLQQDIYEFSGTAKGTRSKEEGWG